MGRSPWYTPGDWLLPLWWTMNPPGRNGYVLTRAEQEAFYSGAWVRKTLGHTGGLTSPPTPTEKARVFPSN